MKRKPNQRLDQKKRKKAGSKKVEFETRDSTQSQQAYFNAQPCLPPPIQYRYGFTNSEFFAFMASLTPYELVTLETVVSILLQINLDTIETKLLANIFIEIGIVIGDIIEQEILQESLENERLNRTNVKLDNRVRELEYTVGQLMQQINNLQNEKNKN